MQIRASGLYPIELMPQFFRNIYPFLLFTYGIDAMRETIAGLRRTGGALWHARHLHVLVGARPVLRRRLAGSTACSTARSSRPTC